MKYTSETIKPSRQTIERSYNTFKSILKEKGIEILLSTENANLPHINANKPHIEYCRSLYCNKLGDSICCRTCELFDSCKDACQNNPEVCKLQTSKRTFTKTRGVRGI